MGKNMKPVGTGPDHEPDSPEEEAVERSNDATFKAEREDPKGEDGWDSVKESNDSTFEQEKKEDA